MNIRELADEVERLHRRIHLFVDDEVWANEIITACHNVAQTRYDSYLEVLESALQMLYNTQLDTLKDQPWIFSTPVTQLVSLVYPKTGTPRSKALALRFP
ncbi:hypothetical protein Phage2-1_00102 [Achromobacter phage 2-1]|nr:hypothetical protein Phage2-1_00102 [Achromobacter phage 2-1]